MSDTDRPDEPTTRTTPPIVPPGDRPAPEPVAGEQPLPGMPAEPDPTAKGDGEARAAGEDDLPAEATTDGELVAEPDAVAGRDVPEQAGSDDQPDAVSGPDDPAEPAGPTADEVTKAARGTDEPDEPTPMPDEGPRRAWQRIRDGLKPSRGQAIVGAVLGLVAFLAVVQVRLNLADDGYANARREDLIAILDGLGQSTRRLESEIAELQQRKSALSSGADRAENARAQAEEQIRVLGILAGTLPAQGPGVRITMTDPDGKVESSNLLDAIEELRDAGAEAIQINGRVRVVASTAFVDDPPGVRVDGTRVEAPYVIEAIGDSHNLSEAANFPGGLVSEIEGPQINGAAEVVMLPNLQITALHTPQEHRYARPAASPTR
jgi:uncharacterized protein YlxW (UPF0749 family)